jgi:general secretion pathway protein C
MLWPSLMHDRPEMWFFDRSINTENSSHPVYNPLRDKLFGKKIVATPKAISDQPAPRTNLQLILNGVFVGSDNKLSGAIISEQGKTANFYHVGDDISGNAVLAEVFEDHVLLKRYGKLEALYFEKAGGNNGSSKVTAVTPSKRQIVSPKQFVEVATRELRDRPQVALASVGLNPVKNGAEEGYVFNGNNPMLRALNLKKGDVIRSVNGFSLGNVEQDRRLLKELYKEGNLEVEVVRGGTSFYVNYPLK